MRERPSGFIVAVAILSIAAVLLFIAGPPRTAATARARPAEEPRTVSVVGEGSARARLDVAHAIIGVEARAASAVEAQAQGAARVAAVVARMLELGVAREGVRTLGVEVTPAEPSGFRAQQTLQVTIGEVEDLARILDAALAAGATSVRRVTFALRDESAVRKQALDRAVRDARARAEAAAAASRVTVRGLRSLVVHHGAPSLGSEAGRSDAPGESVGAASLQAGEGTIRATVQATFDVE